MWNSVIWVRMRLSMSGPGFLLLNGKNSAKLESHGIFFITFITERTGEWGKRNGIV